MSEFQKWTSQHRTIRASRDWNALLDHGLEKPASYIIRKNGSYYEAINGSTGKIDYGGANNAGGVSGTDAATVIQSALNALTSGRTWKERIVFKGEFITKNGGWISVPSYTILDCREARFKLPSGGLYSEIFRMSGGNVEIWGGIFDGNKRERGIHDALINPASHDDVLIIGSTFTDVTNAIVVNNARMTVRDVTFIDCLYGVTGQNTGDVSDFLLDGARFLGTQQDIPIDFDRTKVTGCKLKNFYIDMDAGSAGAVAFHSEAEDPVTDVEISGFTIKHGVAAVDGIHIEGDYNYDIRIENGIIDGEGTGSENLYIKGHRVKIENVICLNSGYNAIYIFGGEDVILENVLAQNAQRNGFHIAAAVSGYVHLSNCVVRNVSLESVSYSGFVIEADNAKLDNCHVAGAENRMSQGFKISGNSVELVSCRVDDHAAQVRAVWISGANDTKIIGGVYYTGWQYNIRIQDSFGTFIQGAWIQVGAGVGTIADDGTSDYTRVFNCIFSGAPTLVIAANSVYKNNINFVTENSGTATIPANTKSYQVTFPFNTTPSVVKVTPSFDVSGRYWVSGLTYLGLIASGAHGPSGYYSRFTFNRTYSGLYSGIIYWNAEA